MRHLLFIALAALLTGCPPPTPPNDPPTDQFYFPAGLVHHHPQGSTEGILFVANANFDRRYDYGSIMAVNLDNVGNDGARLPAFGSEVAATGPVAINTLNLDRTANIVHIASFAGELAPMPLPDGRIRLFVPTRSEGHRVYAVDATLSGSTASLSCVRPADHDGGLATVAPEDGGSCVNFGMSLTRNENSPTGVPRAESPIGITVAPDGEVFIASIRAADSPRSSNRLLRSYVVHLDGNNPQIFDEVDAGAKSFLEVGQGGTSAVVAGKRFVYASGRGFSTTNGVSPGELIRVLDKNRVVTSAGLEATVRIFEARGVALSSDESRLYLAGRSPSALLVAQISGATGDTPAVRAIRTVPLPDGPELVVTIPRPGKSDLVALTAANAGALVFYDDEVGDVVGQVRGLGLQPFSIAVDRRGAGARLFISNFTDGRIAVVDVPDLLQPQNARTVAHLGLTQLCITRGTRAPNCSDGGM